MPKAPSRYHEFPDYRVDLVPHEKPVRVLFADRVIAESARVLRVEETKHAPVLYFPREDVHMEHLVRSSHETFCPFKGDASYWSIVVGDRREDNAVWSYEDPFPEVEGLRGCMAFYKDRLAWE